MKTTNFNWGDNIIDSRDLSSRWEELTEEYDSTKEAVDTAFQDLKAFKNNPPNDDGEMFQYLEDVSILEEELGNANTILEEWEDENLEELELLNSIIEQGKDASDWDHGETLIHENYFQNYIEELIHDCYELPKEFTSGEWPWRHASIDFESAAEDAKQDYMEIDAGGEVYYIRA